jgi:hypothetical protein
MFHSRPVQRIQAYHSPCFCRLVYLAADLVVDSQSFVPCNCLSLLTYLHSIKLLSYTLLALFFVEYFQDRV